MKIRTDVSDAVYRQPKSLIQERGVEARTAAERSRPSIDPQLAQSITSRMNTERSLGEALSIAQASQSLLQKALIISSQLRNMAAQAVTTGKVNSSDLEIALSDINSSFSSYNNALVSPVSTYAIPKPGLPELPGIKPELEEVAATAMSMRNGAVPDRNKFQEIEKTIVQKSGIYDSFIAGASSGLRDLSASYGEGLRSGFDGYRVPRDLIAGNPRQAMAAQGNISPQDVYRIFNS